MYQFEVHYYVPGIAGQLVTVISANCRQSAEDAVRAMYCGKKVQIQLVVRQ